MFMEKFLNHIFWLVTLYVNLGLDIMPLLEVLSEKIDGVRVLEKEKTA